MNDNLSWLDHPKVNALLNVAVFTPVTIYYARGKTPPDWLIIASLAWAGFMFVRDLRVLMQPPETTPKISDLKAGSLLPKPIPSPSQRP